MALAGMAGMASSLAPSWTGNWASGLANAVPFLDAPVTTLSNQNAAPSADFPSAYSVPEGSSLSNPEYITVDVSRPETAPRGERPYELDGRSYTSEEFKALMNPTPTSLQPSTDLQKTWESLATAPLKARYEVPPLKHLGPSSTRICTAPSAIRDYRIPHPTKAARFTEDVLDPSCFDLFTDKKLGDARTEGLDESEGGWSRDKRGDGGRVSVARSQDNASLRQGDAWAKLHGGQLKIQIAEEALQDEFDLIAKFGTSGLLSEDVNNSTLSAGEMATYGTVAARKAAWKQQRAVMKSRGFFTMDDPEYYNVTGAYVDKSSGKPQLYFDPNMMSLTADEAETKGTKSEFSRCHKKLTDRKMKLLLPSSTRDTILSHGTNLSGNVRLTDEQLQAEHFQGGKVSSGFSNRSQWNSGLTLEQILSKPMQFGLSDREVENPSSISHVFQYSNQINPATGGPMMVKAYIPSQALDAYGNTANRYLHINHAEEWGTDSDVKRFIDDARGLASYGIKVIQTESEKAANEELSGWLREVGVGAAQKEVAGCTETAGFKCQNPWCATHSLKNDDKPTYQTGKSRKGRRKRLWSMEQYDKWLNNQDSDSTLGDSEWARPDYEARDQSIYSSAQQTLPTVKGPHATGTFPRAIGPTLTCGKSIDDYTHHRRLAGW